MWFIEKILFFFYKISVFAIECELVRDWNWSKMLIALINERVCGYFFVLRIVTISLDVIHLLDIDQWSCHDLLKREAWTVHSRIPFYNSQVINESTILTAKKKFNSLSVLKHDGRSFDQNMDFIVVLLRVTSYNLSIFSNVNVLKFI